MANILICTLVCQNAGYCYGNKVLLYNKCAMVMVISGQKIFLNYNLDSEYQIIHLNAFVHVKIPKKQTQKKCFLELWVISKKMNICNHTNIS